LVVALTIQAACGDGPTQWPISICSYWSDLQHKPGEKTAWNESQ